MSGEDVHCDLMDCDLQAGRSRLFDVVDFLELVVGYDESDFGPN